MQYQFPINSNIWWNVYKPVNNFGILIYIYCADQDILYKYSIIHFFVRFHSLYCYLLIEEKVLKQLMSGAYSSIRKENSFSKSHIFSNSSQLCLVGHFEYNTGGFEQKDILVIWLTMVNSSTWSTTQVY